MGKITLEKIKGLIPGMKATELSQMKPKGKVAPQNLVKKYTDWKKKKTGGKPISKAKNMELFDLFMGGGGGGMGGGWGGYGPANEAAWGASGQDRMMGNEDSSMAEGNWQMSE